MVQALDSSFIGMKAAIDQLETTGRQLVELTKETDVAKDIVQLSSSERDFEANAEVARAADDEAGSVLDLFA